MEKIICPHCKKVIEGYNKKQLDYLLQQHIFSKHKDKFKVE